MRTEGHTEGRAHRTSALVTRALVSSVAWEPKLPYSSLGAWYLQSLGIGEEMAIPGHVALANRVLNVQPQHVIRKVVLIKLSIHLSHSTPLRQISSTCVPVHRASSPPWPIHQTTSPSDKLYTFAR